MDLLSPEEENYVRMGLLLTGISSRAVRTCFDGEFPPASLEDSLKKKYNKLIDLKDKCLINQLQWNRVFPRSPGVSDSKTFDIILMITLLRNLTNLVPSHDEFDCLPTAMETTLGGDLARMEYYWKYLAHLEDGRVESTDFTTAWDDISEAIGRLGGHQMKKDCDQLRTKTLDQTNPEIMTDIKYSRNEIKKVKQMFESVKRSHKELHGDYTKNTKEVKRLKTFQDHKDDTLPHVRLNRSHRAMQEDHSEIKPSQEFQTKGTQEMEEVEYSANNSVPSNVGVYVQTMIEDWSKGKVHAVFNNINMKKPQFRQIFLSHLNKLDIPYQRKLVHIIDKYKSRETHVARDGDGTFDTSLLHCCYLGDVSLVQWCLYHGVDVNRRTYNNESPINIACEQGHIELVNMLIDRGADYNKYDKDVEPPLMKACEHGHTEIVKMLLNVGAEYNKCFINGQSPLMKAGEHGHPEIVKMLLNVGAEYNKRDSNGQSPLMKACKHGQTEIVKMLLNVGAEYNKCDINGQSPLMKAGKHGHPEIVKMLLNVGAEYNKCDIYGQSPLMKACKHGQTEIVKMLLDLGAEYNKCDNDGQSPLIKACDNGHTEIVKMLLDRGVDCDKSDKMGQSPMMKAFNRGHTEIIKLLLDSGADYTEGANNDRTIPVEIRNMDQQSINIYLRALESGSEKRRDINLVIVGKKGAGKTSLVHRLFGEEFTHLESTNGIEIHRRQCKIKSDEWTRIGEKDKDKESDINNRIMESVVQQFHINSKDQITSVSSHGTIEKQNEYRSTPTSLDKEIIYDRIEDKEVVNKEGVEDKDDIVTVRIGINTTEIESPVYLSGTDPHQPPSPEWDDRQKTTKQIASEELSALFKSVEVLNEKDEDYTTLTLWDFAGDEDFYATHQTFLNPDAVYILVANLNDKDNDNENHKNATFKFWMDTIHCYGCRADKNEVGPIKQDTLLDPPVIFVGTHTDELQDQNECSKQLTSHMDKLCEDTSLHLRKCHQISNKNDDNDKFQKIREDILSLGIKTKTTEKEYPVKFIQLERVLHTEYTSEKRIRILSFKTVKELASNISIPITEEEELNLFLRYQHEIGNLVFFRDIPEYIILDPQWLADAFKCIVTATQFQKEFPYFIEWKKVKATGKISFKLIKAIFNSQPANIREHRDHLLAVMEKFDIIINPLVQPNKSYVSNDESYFYIPCMMQVQKIDEIDKLFKVEDDYKSTCLCFIFNFLPPYLISHLIVSCLRKYSVASVQQQEGLFKDCCVFDVSDCRCNKLLLVKFGNMIELQIWQSNKDKPCQYKEIFNYLQSEIERILTTRYRMTTVSFKKKWKCSLTNYTCENSFEEFGNKQDGDTFMCQEHAILHRYKDDWFCETTKIDLNHRHINFTKMGIITLDVLGDALYDLILVTDPNFTTPRSECDISKLYNIHRNKLNVFIPSRGSWGGQWVDINSNATAPGDDIERIRLTRNELQHASKFELQDARFVQLCNLHKTVLGRLETTNKVSDYLQRFENILKKKMTFQDWKTCKENIIFVIAKVQLPSSTTATKGCGCTINCNINSSLPYESTISWFKEHKGVDEPVIVDSIKYHGSTIEFPSLVISNADKCDEGFYSCRIVYPTNYQYEEDTETVVWPKTYLHVNNQ